MGWWSPVDKAVGNGGASTAVGAVSAANAISWLVTVPVVGIAAGVGAMSWSHERRWLVVVTR